MMPYYPARDGYPSMFELEDTSAAGAANLQQSFVDQLLEKPTAGARPLETSPVPSALLAHLSSTSRIR
jgi:hypothetical protein